MDVRYLNGTTPFGMAQWYFYHREKLGNWCARRDSNSRPLVRSQVLYPTELRARGCRIILENTFRNGGERSLPRIPRSAAFVRPCTAGFSPSGFEPPRHLPGRGVSKTPFPEDGGERDSNPRYAFGIYTLSRGAPSTTRPSLLKTKTPARIPAGARGVKRLSLRPRPWCGRCPLLFLS